MKWIARAELLRLEYNLELVPEGGLKVLLPAAAPIKHRNKDAAGHIFHEWALKQSGFFGAARAMVDTCKHHHLFPFLTAAQGDGLHCLGVQLSMS